MLAIITDLFDIIENNGSIYQCIKTTTKSLLKTKQTFIQNDIPLPNIQLKLHNLIYTNRMVSITHTYRFDLSRMVPQAL